jgi:hypothetical protein
VSDANALKHHGTFSGRRDDGPDFMPAYLHAIPGASPSVVTLNPFRDDRAYGWPRSKSREHR